MAPKERTVATEDHAGSTSKYMSMYGKFSTDGCKCLFFTHANILGVISQSHALSASTFSLTYLGLFRTNEQTVLRIGNECPDFSCKTTHGYWSSFHEWKKGQWAVLCSHPRAFHPVGTTELGSLSQKHKTLQSIGCKTVALSVDSVEDHVERLKDVEDYHSAEEEPVKVQFPIISDGDRAISEAYSMIDPFTMGQQTLTVRSVFVINPENILMLRFDYPACVGVSHAMRYSPVDNDTGYF